MMLPQIEQTTIYSAINFSLNVEVPRQSDRPPGHREQFSLPVRPGGAVMARR